MVRAALDQAKRDGMECVVRPRRRIFTPSRIVFERGRDARPARRSYKLKDAQWLYEKLGLKRVGAVARFRDRPTRPIGLRTLVYQNRRRT